MAFHQKWATRHKLVHHHFELRMWLVKRHKKNNINISFTMFNQMSRVKVYSNGLLFTSQWHLHLADIANAYQSSTLSQMSTDVNKPLRQQSKQLLDREQTGLFAKLNWGCPLSVVRSVCVDGRLTTGAVVTSQGLWWLDERASPGGANGDILNLEQQPVCQYTQRKGRWDRVPGRAALKCGEVSAVCPDREGHGHDSTSYWRSRGDKGVSHNGGEMEEASPMELGRVGGWAGVVFHSCWPVWRTANCHPV